MHEKGDVFRDPDGRAVRMIGTAQDITDRRHLEEQLRHSQKMEALGRLAGGVAHDLNNALTTIAGYTALALAELADDHPARADVEEIRRAAARAESVDATAARLQPQAPVRAARRSISTRSWRA